MVISCSDDGTAVITTINGDEAKESTIYTCQEPITAICCESSVNTNKKERGFLLGTSKGRMVYRKTAWFAQKDMILFPGDGSPVYKIAWKADSSHVAWVDSSLVRIMDISNQTAICQLSPPYGIGVDDPYPCHLFWQTNNELLVGWGDSFRLLEIFSLPNAHNIPSFTPNSIPGDDGGINIVHIKAARTIAEWQTDTIICGLFPFDEDHVVYLGYTPPIDQTISPIEDEAGVGEWIDYDSVAKEEVELIVAHRKTGEIVEADVLPAGRASSNSSFVGPYHCHLLSTYQCVNTDGEYAQWSLHNYLRVRGGDRGHAPLLFVINGESPSLFLCRLSNVTDQITLALEKKQLLTALELAYHNLLTRGSTVTNGGNNGSITVLSSNAKATKVEKVPSASSSGYSYEELFLLYITELIDLGQYDKVHDECLRLIPVILPTVNGLDNSKISFFGDMLASPLRKSSPEILRQNEENVAGLVIWYRLIKNVMQYVVDEALSGQQREEEMHRFDLLEKILKIVPLSLTLATMKEKDESKGKEFPDNTGQNIGIRTLYDDILYFLLSYEPKQYSSVAHVRSTHTNFVCASHNLFVELIKKWSITTSLKVAVSGENKGTLSPLSIRKQASSTLPGGPEAGELFHHSNMIKTLNQLCNHHVVTGGGVSSATVTSLNNHSSSSGRWTSTGLHATGSSNREEYVLKRNSMLLALAYLFSMQHAHKKALTCYLDITIHAVASSSISSILTSTTPITTTSGRYLKSNNVVSLDTHTIKSNVNPFAESTMDGVAVSIMDSSEEDEKQKMAVYKSVFDLIEQDISLFPLIEQRIVNLLALSKTLTAKLLLNHVDKLPISSVANQLLLHDRRALLWYLQLLLLDGHPSILIPTKSSSKKLSIPSSLTSNFSTPMQSSTSLDVGNSSVDVSTSADQGILHGMNLLFIFSASNGTAGDTYRINKHDYAEWHYKQLQLYVELIAQRHAENNNNINQTNGKNSHGSSSSGNIISSPVKVTSGQVGNIYGSRPTPLSAIQTGFHCDFMQFLMAQLVAPDRCLQECERKMSVFFPEIIYLYGVLGQPRRALTLLLYETGDVGGAVRFLQEQYDLAGDRGQASVQNHVGSGFENIEGNNNISSASGINVESKRKEIVGLWDEITDYVIKYPQTLISLLDEVTLLVGHPAMQLHYAQFLPRIPKGVILPGLQQRLQQLLSRHAEQEQLQRYCVSLLQTDARTLLTRKKHFQHRAIRIDPTGGQSNILTKNEGFDQQSLKKYSVNYHGQYAAMTNWKCAYCTKPLLLPAPSPETRCENVSTTGRLIQYI